MTAQTEGVLLAVVASRTDAELAALRLWDFGATAIEERDRPGGDVQLIAGFPTPELRDGAAEELSVRWPTEPRDAVAGWRDAWRAFAQPVRVGSVLLVPAWIDDQVNDAIVRPTASDVIVRIDPGHAFGAGNHPTTRLALTALEARMKPGATVLDVGCGSGVLSVAAVLMGAGSVTAIDIDPHAVSVSLANAQHNGVEDRVSVSTTPLAELAGPYDLVVANLGGTELPVALSADLSRVAAHRGTVIVSGMLDGHSTEVADEFAALGAEVVEAQRLDGWTALTLLRASNQSRNSASGIGGEKR